MPHVILTGPIHPDGVKVLEQAPGVTFEVAERPTPEIMEPLIGKADGLLVRAYPVTSAFISKANRLKVVARHGVGYDEVDVPALTRRGIPLTITPDANAQSVAEHAFMLMLALCRRVVHQDRLTRDGQWWDTRKLSCMELAGRTLFIVGHGRIGSRVGRIAHAFGLRTLVIDPAFAPETLRAFGHEPIASLKDGLKEADIVTLHVPASEQTRGMVNAGFLGQMKKGAYLVNTARGDLADEAALFEALQSGRIAGAGIDVFRKEPVEKGRPLLSHPNAIVTAHTAAFTDASMRRMAVDAAKSILAAFDGKLDRRCVVNAEVLKPD